MPGDRFSWLWELIDRTSTPAKNVAAAMDKVDKATRSAARSHQMMERAAISGKGAHENLFDSLIKFEVLKRVFDKLAEGFRAMMDAVTFRAESLIQLRTVSKSAEEAGQSFDWIERFSARAGIATRAARDFFLQFREVGFSADQSAKLLALTTDIQSIMPKGAERAQLFAAGIETIMQAAEITPRRIRGMTDALGISEQVMASYAATTGQSLKQIRAQWKDANLTQVNLLKPQLLDAIITAARKRVDPGGIFGQGTAETMDLMPRRIQSVREQINRLLSASQLRSSFWADLSDALDPDGRSGAALRRLVVDVTSALSDVFNLGKQGGLADAIATAADITRRLLLPAIRDIGVIVQRTAQDFRDIASFVGRVTDFLSPPAGQTRSGIPTMTPADAAARGLPVTQLSDRSLLGRIFSPQYSGLPWASFGPGAAAAATDAGYAQGVAFEEARLQGSDDAGGRHSPSTEWRLRGQYDSQGYKQGWSRPSSSAGPTVGATAAASSSVSISPGAVTINIQPPSGDPQEIAGAVRKEFVALLEEIAIEGGGAN